MHRCTDALRSEDKCGTSAFGRDSKHGGGRSERCDVERAHHGQPSGVGVKLFGHCNRQLGKDVELELAGDPAPSTSRPQTSESRHAPLHAVPFADNAHGRQRKHS